MIKNRNSLLGIKNNDSHSEKWAIVIFYPLKAGYPLFCKDCTLDSCHWRNQSTGFHYDSTVCTVYIQNSKF